MRWADNVVEESTATTTGAYQLGGVPSGEQPGAQGFVAGIGDGNTCYYYAKEVSGTAWERGIGAVADAATDTLTRTTIHGSSNAGSAVDWTGKTLRVYCVQPARTLYKDHAGLMENVTLVTSRAAGAETIAVKTLAGTDPSPSDPCRIGFAKTDGTFEVLEITSALSVTLSSGSTLGATSGQPFRLWGTLFNDAGAVRLGVVKCALADGIRGLFDNLSDSSTAEGGAGAADTAGVIYSGTAVASKTMRVLGYLEYTLTTAGTWDTAPSLIKLWSAGDKLPGDVVQLRRAVDVTSRSVSNAAFVDSGAFVAITPTSSPNAVLFSIEATLGYSTLGQTHVGLYRGTTSLIPAGAITSLANTLEANSRIESGRASVLDFPGVVTSTPYRIYLQSGSGQTSYLNRRGDNAGGIVAPTIMQAEEIMV